MLHVENLRKSFGPVRALDGISFSVGKGEIVGFLGPNGAGKTTAMRIIAGFLSAGEGRVTLDGVDVPMIRWPSGQGRVFTRTAATLSRIAGSEYLTFVAGLKGVHKRSDRQCGQDHGPSNL